MARMAFEDFEPPQRLVRALAEIRRPEGGDGVGEWLENLPELARQALDLRELSVERVQAPGGRSSLVLLVRLIDGTPAVGEQLSVLQQKEMVLRERYLDSLRKVEQAKLAENLENAQQGAQVSILDHAHMPTSPERPRWMLGVAGLLASLGFGVAVMILLELVDPVIVSTRQLDRLGDAGCLGSLPLQV